MATTPPSSPSSPTAGPVMQPAQEAKTPRLTAKQLEVLKLLSDGRVRKATTKTSPTTDEVNGTTAGSMVAYGYVEQQQLGQHTVYRITGEGRQALQRVEDRTAMLASKKAEQAKQSPGTK